MKIAIIGSGIEVFSCGHRLLDLNSELEIHIFDEKAESGMYGEEPGIFSEWPLTPLSWYGNLFAQEPNEKSTAVRYSWFVKSLSISLAQRGVNIHLKTVVKNIETGKIEFYGAGYKGFGNIVFDHVIDFREKNQENFWYGGVTLFETSSEITGMRPDRTIEVWSMEGEIEGNVLQKMVWSGENPITALTSRIDKGIEAAESIIC